MPSYASTLALNILVAVAVISLGSGVEREIGVRASAGPLVNPDAPRTLSMSSVLRCRRHRSRRFRHTVPVFRRQNWQRTRATRARNEAGAGAASGMIGRAQVALPDLKHTLCRPTRYDS